MHGLADGAGFGRRSGDVEQQQHRQVALRRRTLSRYTASSGAEPATHLDARLHCGVDVDVITLRLAMPALKAHPEAGQRTPQRKRFLHRLRRARLDDWLGLVHGAPVDAIRPPVDIPFGVLPTIGADVLMSSADTGAVDATAMRRAVGHPAVRWVGASAPGGPPPLPSACAPTTTASSTTYR